MEIRNPNDFYNNQYVLSLYQDGPLHRPCQYQMMLRIIERLLYKYLSCLFLHVSMGMLKLDIDFVDRAFVYTVSTSKTFQTIFLRM